MQSHEELAQQNSTFLTPVAFPDGQDRRGSARVPLELPVKVGPAKTPPSTPLSAADFSEGGIFIRSDRLAKVGARFSVAIPMLTGEQVEIAEAEVLYNTSDSQRPGFGARFIDLPEELADKLRSEVTEVLIQAGVTAAGGTDDLLAEGEAEEDDPEDVVDTDRELTVAMDANSNEPVSASMILGTTETAMPPTHRRVAEPKVSDLKLATIEPKAITTDKLPRKKKSRELDQEIPELGAEEDLTAPPIFKMSEFSRAWLEAPTQEPEVDTVEKPEEKKKRKAIKLKMKRPIERDSANEAEADAPKNRNGKIRILSLAAGATCALMIAGGLFRSSHRAEKSALPKQKVVADLTAQAGLSGDTQRMLLGAKPAVAVVVPESQKSNGEAQPARPLPPLVLVDAMSAPASSAEPKKAEKVEKTEKAEPKKVDKAEKHAAAAKDPAPAPAAKKSGLAAFSITLATKARVLKTYVFKSPNRFVIDLEHQEGALKLPALSDDVGAIRVGKHDGFTRLVIDTKHPIKKAEATRQGDALKVKLES